MIRLAVPATVGITFALAVISFAAGQGPDVQIFELDCDSDPELVVIKNFGDGPQELAGWQLQSDPPDSEVFDLSALGGLQPGVSNFIQSGPSASGVFKWGEQFIFRDNDPTDYVRIVDDTGTVVHQVNCGGVAPEPTPSPSPEPSPAGEVPNGGGPPPLSSDTWSSAVMVLIGGAVAALGVATITVSWLRVRPLVAAAPFSVQRESAAARLDTQRRPVNAAEGRFSGALGLALLGFAVAVVLLLFGRRGP